MYELTVEIPFSAAHRIPGHPGRCARLHGHSYRALVTVGGPGLDGQGMLMDFGALKEICSQVIAPLDHVYLNELPGFVSSPPTAERIARHIYEGIAALLGARPGGGVAMVRVAVYESERSSATYQE